MSAAYLWFGVDFTVLGFSGRCRRRKEGPLGFDGIRSRTGGRHRSTSSCGFPATTRMNYFRRRFASWTSRRWWRWRRETTTTCICCWSTSGTVPDHGWVRCLPRMRLLLLLLLLLRVSAVAAIEHFRLDRVALDEFVIVGLVLIDGLVQVHYRMDQPRLLNSFGGSNHSAFSFGSRMGRRAVRISVFRSILNL